MSQRRNIYRIDGYFIKIGILLVVIAGFAILFDPRMYIGDELDHIENSIKSINGESIKNESVSNFPLVRVIIMANGLILFFIGLIIRGKERKIVSIWNALDRTGEARVNELAVSLGLTRDFVLKCLPQINSQPNTYYVWDEKQDKILDGRLRTEFMIVANCSGCGNNINARFSLCDSIAPKCNYCHNPIASPEDILKYRKDILQNRLVITDGKKEISWTLFIVLIFVFWPAAIGYLIYKRK